MMRSSLVQPIAQLPHLALNAKVSGSAMVLPAETFLGGAIAADEHWKIPAVTLQLGPAQVDASRRGFSAVPPDERIDYTRTNHHSSRTTISPDEPVCVCWRRDILAKRHVPVKWTAGDAGIST